MSNVHNEERCLLGPWYYTLFITIIELIMKAISYLSDITRLSSSICKSNCHVCFISILANKHHTLCLFPEIFRIIVNFIPAYQNPIPFKDMAWINVRIMQFLSMCFQNSVNSIKKMSWISRQKVQKSNPWDHFYLMRQKHECTTMTLQNHDTSNS